MSGMINKNRMLLQNPINYTIKSSTGPNYNYNMLQGDGGGPLVCEDNGYYELTGLVSWGFGCGRKDVPGVYVKISSFIGWINQIISVNNL